MKIRFFSLFFALLITIVPNLSFACSDRTSKTEKNSENLSPEKYMSYRTKLLFPILKFM